MSTFSIQGNIVDIKEKNIFWGSLEISNNRISQITNEGLEKKGAHYILPGFIDSHVHIESSMLVPSEFAKLAVVHGTVGTISDPHEIANVCGMEGVRYMIENGNTVPFKCTFGAPSCVPATIFETAGAAIDADDIDVLLQMPEIKYLSEMMNFPGVLFDDAEVLKKIASAKKYNKPVDGHAPGLRGDDAKKYIDAGISTDHECFTAEEALDKLKYGMKILIREGSAAKNFEALIDLMHEHSDMMMFCSDDKHPDSLAAGHINQLCARAVKKGIAIFKVLKAACINPVEHYKMDVGLLNIGDFADCIIVKDLVNFEVVKTFIDGILVAENGLSFINAPTAAVINQFDCNEKMVNEFSMSFNGENEIMVIEALDGQLITNKILFPPKVIDGKIVSDVENDILKIVVVNRYYNAPIAKAFIKNIGLKKGALASSVAHDSHNIVAVGTDDESLCRAVNAVIKCGGGVSAVDENNEKILPLPVAGLMSTNNGYEVAKAYTEIDLFTKLNLGSTLSAPFMTLSFMALLVIPHLKLSDKGLFNGDRFEFVS
ncbi:MAG: adenine deaminase [Bacteroidota bacterium]